MEIRVATVEDWPAIWPLVSRVAREQETYAFEPDLAADEAREMWLAPPPWEVVVAVDDDGAVLGTAKMGPNRDGPGSHVGTASFIVAPEAQGRGVGRALGEHVVAWHRDRGYRGIQFNAVVETNTAAVALWQSLGFEIVGTVPGAFEHPTDGYVGLHVMYLPLV